MLNKEVQVAKKRRRGFSQAAATLTFGVIYQPLSPATPRIRKKS
jgi:hypothetical protein